MTLKLPFFTIYKILIIEIFEDKSIRSQPKETLQWEGSKNIKLLFQKLLKN